MEILLANPRGFCAGVNRAIECLTLAIEQFGQPVYVYHEIVHNTWVVGDFRDRGAIFVDDLGEVPDGAILMYSAHGVSPAVRQQAKERKLRTIDATCPLVRRVHDDAVQFAHDGYRIVLIGHAGHDEVVGVMGEAPDAIRLVETLEDVDHLDFPAGTPVAYLTQTTLSVDEARQIIERLKERYPNIAGSSSKDVCFATERRQSAVRRLAGDADLVLVVGSPNSSNSRRLAEIAQAVGTQAHLIDGPDDIDLGWLEGVEKLVITAGASAPETVVGKCVDLIRKGRDVTIREIQAEPEHVSFSLPDELAD